MSLMINEEMPVMEEKPASILPLLSQNGRKLATRPPAHPRSNKTIPEGLDSKKQNCLCAPTTHAGSFRCRLHRNSGPPASIPTSHLEKKRAAHSQKHFSQKVKLAVHQRLRQGSNKRMMTPSIPVQTNNIPQQIQQDQVPGMSRLSKTSTATEQNEQTIQTEEEETSESEQLKPSEMERHSTIDCSSDHLHPEAIETIPDVPSEKRTRTLRPLVKLPSI